MSGPPTDAPPLFTPAETLPDALPADPFPIFVGWFEDAMARRHQPNPNSMTLASVDGAAAISARVLLCKEIRPDPGYILFFTNYHSRKGQELEGDARAAAVFHWDHQERQVRVEGRVVKSPAEESDTYFATRPWDSRIGAWASQQSQPLASRAQLMEQIGAVMARFGLDPAHPPGPNAQVSIPRPPHWGGYRLYAERVELWCSCPGRLHDRAAWVRKLTPDGRGGFGATAWTATRLQP